MTDAPDVLWLDQATVDSGYAYTHDPYNPFVDKYTLASKAEARIAELEAQVAAADELATASMAMARMIEASLQGTGMANVSIAPDNSLTLNDAFKRLTSYRKAKETQK